MYLAQSLSARERDLVPPAIISSIRKEAEPLDHSIIVEKFGIRLRPVRLSDAGFIVNVHNSAHALGYVGDSAQTEASQRDWLNEYFVRPGDYYFIIELAENRQMLGTIGIYNIRDGAGEVGRLIILPGVVPSAPASYWLITHVFFAILGLDAEIFTVVESNSAITFFKHIGAHLTGASKPHIIASKPVNLLEYRVTRSEWPLISANLTRCALIAKKLRSTLH